MVPFIVNDETVDRYMSRLLGRTRDRDWMLRYRLRLQYGEDETEEMCLFSKIFYIESDQSTEAKTLILRNAWTRCMRGLGTNRPEYVSISLELWGLEYKMYTGYQPQSLFGRSVDVYDKQIFPRLDPSVVSYRARSLRTSRESVGTVPRDK